MEDASGTIHDILALEEELKERIAAVEAELATEVAALRAANETICLGHEEELRRERDALLAATGVEAAGEAAAKVARAEEYARRLESLDDATLSAILLPLLRALLPGRGP